MPIKVTDLDDRSYADLVQEGLALIPAYSREWTNHNAADPGVTFLELFAYLTDVMLYRLNRVSHASRTKFVKMLTGEADDSIDHDALEEALRKASASLRQCSRAVTCDDYERIAREATASEPTATQVLRVKCFQRRHFDPAFENERYRDRPGHTSVVLIPGDPWAMEEVVRSLCEKVRAYFEPRRLLTSRVHISGPRYLEIGLRIRGAVAAGVSISGIRTALANQLIRWFHPLVGGPEGAGWPFGRSVFTSDIYRTAKAVRGIRLVERVEFDVGAPERLQFDDLAYVTEICLRPDELVKVRIDEIALNSLGNGSGSGARA